MNHKLLVLFCSILLSFISCSRDEEAIVEKLNPASVDVYVAGVENNKACYWKNGVINYLQNGDGITPQKIIVDNNVVYVLGVSDTLPYNFYLWKNNVKTDINQNLGLNANTGSSSQYHLGISDFQIDQGDIYLMGLVRSPIIQIPPNGTNFYTQEHCYWKNGVKTVFFNDNSNVNQPFIITKNFTVHNGEVYIPTNKILHAYIGSPYELGYFKNNTYNMIASYSDHKNFRHISKNSNGVYLSIYDEVTNNSYYKNVITNTDSYFSQTVKSNFIIDGNDIYDFSNGQDYFKNDVAIPLTYASGFNKIEDFSALNQNVYQIRSKSTNDQKESYKVYINNIEVQQISATNGVFISIFVVQN